MKHHHLNVITGSYEIWQKGLLSRNWQREALTTKHYGTSDSSKGLDDSGGSAEMRRVGVDAASLRRGGFLVSELRAGGYSDFELSAGGFTLAEIVADDIT